MDADMRDSIFGSFLGEAGETGFFAVQPAGALAVDVLTCCAINSTTCPPQQDFFFFPCIGATCSLFVVERRAGMECVDIFEVFKLKSVEKDSLAEMSFAEKRKKYVLLKALEKEEDLEGGGVMLGTINSGRMVVDKAGFEAEIGKRVRELVSAKRSAEVDSAIERLERDAKETLLQQQRELQTMVLRDVLQVVAGKTAKALSEEERRELYGQIAACFVKVKPDEPQKE